MNLSSRSLKTRSTHFAMKLLCLLEHSWEFSNSTNKSLYSVLNLKLTTSCPLCSVRPKLVNPTSMHMFHFSSSMRVIYYCTFCICIYARVYCIMLCVYDVVVKKFTFAISSPDEFLVTSWCGDSIQAKCKTCALRQIYSQVL